MDCADIILCNVCMDENNQCSCCGGAAPMCDVSIDDTLTKYLSHYLAVLDKFQLKYV